MCPGGQYIGSIEQNILLSLENPPVFELRDSRDEIRAVVQSDFTKSGLGLKRDVKVSKIERFYFITKVWSKKKPAIA